MKSKSILLNKKKLNEIIICIVKQKKTMLNKIHMLRKIYVQTSILSSKLSFLARKGISRKTFVNYNAIVNELNSVTQK